MARKSFLGNIVFLASIRSRMFLAMIAIAVLFGLALWSFRYTTEQTRQKLHEMVWVYTPLQNNAQKILLALEQYKQLAHDLAYTADTTQRGIKWIKIQKLWKDGIQNHADSIRYQNRQVTYIPLQDMYKELLFRLKKHLNYLPKLHKQVFQGTYSIYLPTQNEPQGVKRWYVHTLLPPNIAVYLTPAIEEMREIVGECERKTHILQVTQDFETDNANPFNTWIFWGTWCVSVGLCLGWLWQIRQMHQDDMSLLQTFPRTLSKGDIPKAIEPALSEHKPLAQALNTLVKPFSDLKAFAQNINNEQKENKRLSLFGNRGELGKALSQMREELLKDAKQNEIQNIINTGLAKFADIFAKYGSNITQLSDAFLENLVSYLQANQGGLFLMENEGGIPYLELKASFAYNQKRYSERIVEAGQGLIGQVWKEGETSYVREIPQFYVNITSGLGEATPDALLIVPLKANNTVLGVVELASFQEFLPHQRQFVEKVAENMAQVIANSQQAEQTRYLLQESQALAQNLQAREAELKEKMATLQFTQHKMESAQTELEEKENNLQGLINNTSHAIIAFDKLYKITVINKAMRQMYLEQGILLEVGKNLLEEMPQNDFAKRHKDFFRVLSGEKFVTLERTERHKQGIYHELHYNPILNEDKQVLGASIFMENITQQKMSEVYLKETEANLNSLINNTEDAIMALDNECRILVFNEMYAKQFKERGYTLQRGKSIFDYLPTEKHKAWREYYQRALQGERLVKVIDSGKFPDKTYTEHWFNPIWEDNNVVGLSIFAHDITETRKAEIQSKQVLLESLEETERLKNQNQELAKQIADYKRKMEDLTSNPT